jgi:hypothetical protein
MPGLDPGIHQERLFEEDGLPDHDASRRSGNDSNYFAASAFSIAGITTAFMLPSVSGPTSL